jgi:hypothetical protein
MRNIPMSQLFGLVHSRADLEGFLREIISNDLDAVFDVLEDPRFQTRM